MSASSEQEDDQFGALVESAAWPTTDPSPRLMLEIEALAEAVVAPRPRRRRVAIAAVVLVPLLMLGGTGAALAAGGMDWSSFFPAKAAWTGWATNPDASIDYRLPSGKTCTMRIGDVSFAPAADRPASATAIPPWSAWCAST